MLRICLLDDRLALVVGHASYLLYHGRPGASPSIALGWISSGVCDCFLAFGFTSMPLKVAGVAVGTRYNVIVPHPWLCFTPLACTGSILLLIVSASILSFYFYLLSPCSFWPSRVRSLLVHPSRFCWFFCFIRGTPDPAGDPDISSFPMPRVSYDRNHQCCR